MFEMYRSRLLWLLGPWRQMENCACYVSKNGVRFYV